jgi:hypothetical protein
MEAERINNTFRHAMGDGRDSPKHGPSVAERLAQGGRVLKGLEKELQENTRPPGGRTQQDAEALKPPQPAGDKADVGEKVRAFSDGRPRRLAASSEAIPEKGAAKTMLVIASNGADVVCEHNHRVDMQCNKAKTRMFIVFGTVQILVWGRRLELLRDAIEAHRIDLLEVASNPDIDMTCPFREHIMQIEIRFFRPLEYDEKGEFSTAREEQ